MSEEFLHEINGDAASEGFSGKVRYSILHHGVPRTLDEYIENYKKPLAETHYQKELQEAEQFLHEHLQYMAPEELQKYQKFPVKQYLFPGSELPSDHQIPVYI